MFNDKSWIKLWRKSLHWQWWTDVNVAHLYMTMLLKANIKESYWQGVYIPEGSFASSYNTLAIESGLTVMQVRRAVKCLEKTQEITHKQHGKFSVFTVVAWGDYQKDNKQTTRKQQTDNSQTTFKQQQNKNNNKNKNIKEEKEEGSFEPSVDSANVDDDYDDEFDNLPTLTWDEAKAWEKEHGRYWEGIIYG